MIDQRTSKLTIIRITFELFQNSDPLRKSSSYQHDVAAWKPVILPIQTGLKNHRMLMVRYVIQYQWPRQLIVKMEKFQYTSWT